MTPKSFLRIAAAPCLVAVALLATGCGSDGNSPSETQPIDTTPPAVPADLAVTPVDYTLNVSWTENAEPDLAGYVLERSLDRGQTWSPVSASPLTVAAWEDGYHGRAEYRVSAVDVSENQSAFSGPVTFVAISGGGPKMPATPATP